VDMVAAVKRVCRGMKQWALFATRSSKYSSAIGEKGHGDPCHLHDRFKRPYS
jgi:hypothetical protein